MEAGKLELEQHPFKLIEVLSDAGLFAISAQKKGLAFIENVPPSLYDGYLMGDSLRLKQILANFLSNSLKFTAKGSVTLRVRQEEESEAGQVIVTFEVEDTGVGIEEHAMPRLFSPFQYVCSAFLFGFVAALKKTNSTYVQQPSRFLDRSTVWREWTRLVPHAQGKLR